MVGSKGRGEAEARRQASELRLASPLPRSFRQAAALIVEAGSKWYAHNASSMAATLSFYTIFSIAPTLILLISAVGLVFGRDAVQGEIVNQIRGLVGTDGAKAIQDLIASADRPASGILASAFGIVVILLGAVGVLVALQDALNTIWEVPPNPDAGIRDAIHRRIMSLLLILALGFVLLVSLAVSAFLAAAGQYFSDLLPGNQILWRVADVIVSVGAIAALFAVMFKYVPDTPISWSDTWAGAVITAILFSVGKLAVGLYLGQSGVASAFGAAASLVVVLLWVYYSAQIFFFGAELTRAWALRHGSRGRERRSFA